MGGVITTFIQPNMDHLLSDIQDGTPDFALTKPVDSRAILSLRDMHFWSVTDVVVGVTMLGLSITQLQERSARGRHCILPSRSFWVES